MRQREDLTGHPFGRLTVQGYSHSIKRGPRQYPYWNCRCECGTVKPVSVDNLRSGHAKSCGCLSPDRTREVFTIHGMTDSPEFKIWTGILTRCYNPEAKSFDHYGGAGITMCEEWKSSFQAFLFAVGLRPSPVHSIDRFPNRDGNYEPGNVRWATPEEQANNKRNNVRVWFAGQRLPIQVWARLLGIPGNCLWQRLCIAKWTVQRAFNTPVRPKFWKVAA